MSNPVTYVNNIVGAAQKMVDLVEFCQQLNDMATADSTLITRYFQTAGARTDIVAQDVTNALAAFTQLEFTYNSGSPSQKSYLFKMLP